jgi:hypothetical protein
MAASTPTTRYIAAYDTEAINTCATACKLIRAVHEQFDFPGTFFIVGKRLEEEGAEYRAILGDVEAFDIPFVAIHLDKRAANANCVWAKSGWSRPSNALVLGCVPAVVSTMRCAAISG